MYLRQFRTVELNDNQRLQFCVNICGEVVINIVNIDREINKSRTPNQVSCQPEKLEELICALERFDNDIQHIRNKCGHVDGGATYVEIT